MIKLNKRNKKMNKIFGSNAFLNKMWRILTPFHKSLIMVVFVTAIFELIRMGGPYVFGKILDLLIASDGQLTLQTALIVAAGLVGVRLVALIIDYLARLFTVALAFKVEKHVVSEAFNKLMSLSLDYHERVSTGAKISLVNRGTDKLVNLVDSFIFEFLPTTLQLIITCVIITLVNWRIGLIFTFSIVPFLLITFWIYRSTSKLRSKRHDAYDKSSGEAGDLITNITVVKAYAQEQREQQSFNLIRNVISSIGITEFKKYLFSGFGRNLIIEVFYFVILVLGLVEIRANVLTVGGLVFLINLAERSYSNIYRLGRIYERAVDASEPVDRLANLMKEKPSVVNFDDAKKVEKIDGAITFNHVDFAYKKKLVLKDVSFHIPAGSFTALVGKSGSGKSTIAKLLSRYYDPTGGEILIDETHPLKKIDIDTFRQQSAVVFQDSPVPSRKIWEIIAYSAGKSSFASVKDQVYKAAKLAYSHEFIEEFEDGYNTEVGERGVKLSGGQKQRLAIARALFADPKILIMDEPTSHLDTLSEAMIQKALGDISQKRTLTKIIIAHRLSTVQHADQILVMHNGELVEKGTHKELLKNNGVYSKIVAQSELKD